jgi:hypothetical protein
MFAAKGREFFGFQNVESSLHTSGTRRRFAGMPLLRNSVPGGQAILRCQIKKESHYKKQDAARCWAGI